MTLLQVLKKEERYSTKKKKKIKVKKEYLPSVCVYRAMCNIATFRGVIN